MVGFLEFLESKKSEILYYRCREDRAKMLLKFSAVYADSLGIPVNDRGMMSDMLMKNDPKIEESFRVMSFNMKLFSAINGKEVSGEDELSIYLRQILEY